MMSILVVYAAVSSALALPPGLLQAVCYVESRHKVTAVNLHDGGSPSRGVCQVKLGTARSLGFMGTARELQEPPVNVYYAGKILKYQLNRCRSIDPAILAYSSGKCSKGNRTYLYKVRSAWRTHL